MPTSHDPLPRRRVLVLALGLMTMGMLENISGGRAPRAQTPPQAAASPAPAATAPQAPAAPSGFDFAGQREAVFKAFYSTGLDTSTAYSVTNLAIKKDTMTLLLKQGTVFLMKPIGGEVTGGAFIGDGEASMTPPNRAQRFMLNKYYGAEALREPFTEAVFRFSDGTDRLIRAMGKTAPADATALANASRIFGDRNDWLNGTRELHLEMQFLENRISGLKGQDFFIGDFHSPKHDWLTYSYNPEEIHENIITASKTMGAKNRRYLVSWVQWHKQADYDQAGHYVINPARDGPRLIRIVHHDLNLDMPSTKVVEWEATLNVDPQADSLRALRFDLDNNADPEQRWYADFRPIRVLAVTDPSGQALPFSHLRDQLLVLLNQPAHPGTPLTLKVKGTAEVIYQLTAESFGLLEGAWYPSYGYRGGRGSFHWTATVPKPFLITGSGKFIREFEDKERGLNGIETLCELPVEFPWIIFGRFQRNEAVYTGEESKKSIPLTIHSFPTMTVTITDQETLDLIGASQPITVNLTAPAKKIEGFFEETKQVLKLYEKIYGPYPYDALHIAQMAPQLSFGQAPQGFVQLWGVAFMTQAAVAANEMTGVSTSIDFAHGLLAHEIAHQWWGHQIDTSSDDDEWLSESFAEYASGIFVKEYQGAKRFQRTLEEWKKNARVGDPEAPISAANMLSGPNAFDYRIYLLYNKGPYVLHMLRVQLDDETYSKVMRSVQETYKNRNISTEMLLSQINRVTGADYTYFFDQWFWDVGIPKFRYSWRSEKQPDGKFLITVHVSQADKSHIKRVLMPIHLHFKDKTIPQYKPVVQQEQDIKIISPAEPKDVTLDDEHTLLADIVKAG
jgi:peptidase M1-like protein